MTYRSGPLACNIQLQESSPLEMLNSKGRGALGVPGGTSAVKYAVSNSPKSFSGIRRAERNPAPQSRSLMFSVADAVVGIVFQVERLPASKSHCSSAFQRQLLGPTKVDDARLKSDISPSPRTRLNSVTSSI